MIIYLKELLEDKDRKKVISGELDGFTEDDIDIQSPVKISGDVSINSDMLKVSLNIRYKYETSCDRCLKEIVLSENLDILEEYKLDEYFTDEKINIDEIVYENIILNKKAKFLCKDDCKGLCPICGADLNEEECECEKEYINPKFAKLGKLLDKK